MPVSGSMTGDAADVDQHLEGDPGEARHREQRAELRVGAPSHDAEAATRAHEQRHHDA
jgi:hypothetical protein